MHLDREAEAAAFPWAYSYRTAHLRLGRIFLLLLGHIIERAAEAGRVAGGEQMLWGRGTRLARPAHFLGYGQVRPYEAVARLSVSVPAADRSRGRGEEGFDLVHEYVSFAAKLVRSLNRPGHAQRAYTARPQNR